MYFFRHSTGHIVIFSVNFGMITGCRLSSFAGFVCFATPLGTKTTPYGVNFLPWIDSRARPDDLQASTSARRTASFWVSSLRFICSFSSKPFINNVTVFTSHVYSYLRRGHRRLKTTFRSLHTSGCFPTGYPCELRILQTDSSWETCIVCLPQTALPRNL